jgi:hypothetical protein
MVLFANYKSVIVSKPSLTNFERDLNMIFKMNEWFSANLLSLNFGKSHFMHF